MILYVMRHGETEFNVQGRYAGSTDVPLNAAGIAQAEAAAQALAGVPFDGIASSSMLRALQTARIIAARHPGAPIIPMAEFVERNMGVYEGLTRAEARERYPKLWAKLGNPSPDDAPTGGESARQVDARIRRGLGKLKEVYADQSVLLVCHGYAARAINRILTNLSFEEMRGFMLGNCEVATYTI